MAIDIQSLGKLICKTRKRLGMTQDQMAAEFSISRPTYSEIEKGLRTPTLDQLSRIAVLAQEPIDNFLGGSVESDSGLVALLRLTSTHSNAPNFEREIKKFYKICRIGADLSTKLGLPVRSGPRPYDVTAPMSAGSAFSEGIAAAKAERKRLGLGLRPIPDMADLLTAQNIWASGADLPDEISGLFMQEQDLGMVVLVNGKHKRARKRFSYAHEYAHALLDSSANAKISDRESQDKPTEIRANAFAAEFLLPEHGIEEFLRANGKGDAVRLEHFVYEGEVGNKSAKRLATKRSPKGVQTIGPFDVTLLANEYGVSYEAATYRLNSTRHVNRKEMEQLLDRSDFATKALSLLHDKINTLDEDRRDRDLVCTIVTLTIRALQNKLISRSELIQIADELEKPWRDFTAF